MMQIRSTARMTLLIYFVAISSLVVAHPTTSVRGATTKGHTGASVEKRDIRVRRTTPSATSAGTLTIVGIVRDAQSGRPIAGAVVGVRSAAQGGRTKYVTGRSDSSGHYRVRVARGASFYFVAGAIGYRPVMGYKREATGLARVVVNFAGAHGLSSAFLPQPSDGKDDALHPFQQAVPSGIAGLTFSGVAHTSFQDSFVVTFPDGNAESFPLTVTNNAFVGHVAFDHGSGVYELEINRSGGDALYNLPIFVGVVPITALPALYPPVGLSQPLRALEAEVLSYLNTVRVRAGRPALQLSGALVGAARAHSADVLAHPSLLPTPHVGSDGSNPWQRIRASGIPFVMGSEAIDQGDADEWSPRGAIDDLMGSPGHRMSLLFTAFDRVGIGVARDSQGHIVLTIDFAASACTVLFYGTFRTDKGTPVTNLRISVGDRTTTTDTNGYFQIDAPINTRNLDSFSLGIQTNDGRALHPLAIPSQTLMEAVPINSTGRAGSELDVTVRVT